jgi:hypothetical protein
MRTPRTEQELEEVVATVKSERNQSMVSTTATLCAWNAVSARTGSQVSTGVVTCLATLTAQSWWSSLRLTNTTRKPYRQCLSSAGESLPPRQILWSAQGPRQSHERAFPGAAPGLFQMLTHDLALGDARTAGCVLQPTRKLFCETNGNCMTHMAIS